MNNYNNYVNYLNQFVNQQKICAVYFKSPNGLSNLELYFCEYKNNEIILIKKFNDLPFFNFLYKNHQIGKNNFLEFIHKNYKKERFIHLQKSLDIIITQSIN